MADESSQNSEKRTNLREESDDLPPIPDDAEDEGEQEQASESVGDDGSSEGLESDSRPITEGEESGVGASPPSIETGEPSRPTRRQTEKGVTKAVADDESSADSDPGEDTGSYEYDHDSSGELSSELTPGPAAEESGFEAAGEQTPPNNGSSPQLTPDSDSSTGLASEDDSSTGLGSENEDSSTGLPSGNDSSPDLMPDSGSSPGLATDSGSSSGLAADSDEETGPVDYDPSMADREAKASPEQSNELASPERRAFQDSMAADLDADEPEALDPENLLGVTIDDRYHIEECIGAGGMAVVYRAHQEALDRDIVIKVLPEELVDDDEAVARFEREARGMSQLEHPHVVSTYDFGQEEGVAYICMEYVEGETLAQRVAQGPIPLQEFCTIAVQILQGIGDAHAMGMVHRDIKPANIMLCERRGFDHYVKLLDFGLAKLLQGTRDVTKEQKLVGSVSFLSPEQIMGKTIDERVDVYSLGVLFYYMLSGEKPFTAEEDIRVLYQHVHNSPSLLYNRVPEGTEIPERLVDLIHRCLSKKPENRPESSNALLEEFTSVVPPGYIHLPWSTGEFSAAPKSRLDPDTPRDSLSPPAEATPSSSRDILDSDSQEISSSTTRVDGSPLAPEKDSWVKSNLPLIAAGVLVVGGLGLVAALMSGGGEEESSDQTPSDQQKAAVAAKQNKETEESEDEEEKKQRPVVEKPSVRIESNPGGKVTIDGREVGSSPVKTTLDPGEHKLQVTSEDHEPWTKTVKLKGGDVRTYRPSLTPKESEEESQPSAGSGGAGTRRGRGGGRRRGTRSGSTRGSSGSRRGSTGTAARESGSGGRATDESEEKKTAETSGSQDSSKGTASAEKQGGEDSTSSGTSSGAESTTSGSGGSEKSDDSESGVGLLPTESSDSSDDSEDDDDEGGGLLPVGE